jgi:hypothetical protein
VQVRPFFVTLTRSASAVRYDRTKGYISVDYGNYESKSQAGKRCLDDSLVVYIESDAATKNRPEIPLKAVVPVGHYLKNRLVPSCDRKTSELA